MKVALRCEKHRYSGCSIPAKKQGAGSSPKSKDHDSLHTVGAQSSPKSKDHDSLHTAGAQSSPKRTVGRNSTHGGCSILDKKHTPRFADMQRLAFSPRCKDEVRKNRQYANYSTFPNAQLPTFEEVIETILADNLQGSLHS